VAPAPLYNSFDDVFEFAERLSLALSIRDGLSARTS
jgi:hypothetical protein